MWIIAGALVAIDAFVLLTPLVLGLNHIGLASTSEEFGPRAVAVGGGPGWTGDRVVTQGYSAPPQVSRS
jgi:hypothetical protein